MLAVRRFNYSTQATWLFLRLLERKTPVAIMVLLTMLGTALTFVPAPIYAQGPACGATITTNTTLTANIGPCAGEGLAIGASGITLDCAGHTISGTGSSPGIDLSGVTSATVENCRVMIFDQGFFLSLSSGNTLTGNTADNNTDGFVLASSSKNTLTGNTADYNAYGFSLTHSSKNKLTGNAADSNLQSGFLLQFHSTHNKLATNTADGNGHSGFLLQKGSNKNTLTGNTADKNFDGFTLLQSKKNTLTGNTADSNTQYGYLDKTRGSGTLGTANNYSNDECSNNGVGGSHPRGLGSPQP